MVKDGEDWQGLQRAKLFKRFNRDVAPLLILVLPIKKKQKRNMVAKSHVSLH